MKQLVIAIIMFLAALSAKAQVITSETIKNVHNEMMLTVENDYVYNVEYTGSNITTKYVYEKEFADKDIFLLKPYLKYDYTYASDGILTNKVCSRWDNIRNDWKRVACYDYAVAEGQYTIEYSRYNPKTNGFDEPIDRTVYSLIPFNGINNVSCYHRDSSSSQFQLVSEIQVENSPILYAEQ